MNPHETAAAPAPKNRTELDTMYDRLERINERLSSAATTTCGSVDRILGPVPVATDVSVDSGHDGGKIYNINNSIDRIEAALSDVEHSITRLQDLG